MDKQERSKPPIEEHVGNDEFYPTLHVEECARLLQQCDSLSNLCLKFEDVSIADLSPEVLKENQGLRQLCSIFEELSVRVTALGDKQKRTC